MTTPPIPFNTSEMLLDDGMKLFKQLLRIDTTNPPGNEIEATRQVTTWLEEVGVSSETLEAAPGRASMMACLGEDTGDALVLSAHLDVVPADESFWTHPPFAAEEADGCIWGRGTIDMKNMAAYAVAIMRELARSGTPLKRALKLVLVADEEAGCEKGSLHVARNRPEWLTGAVALTEVGGFTMHVDGHRIYPIQTAEKGFVWLRLHIRGTPGHGSIPHGEGALEALADIVQQLADQPFPFHCTQPVQDFLDEVGAVLGFPKGPIFRFLGNPTLHEFIRENVVRDHEKTRIFQALTRDTAAATMAEAGTKANVIPGTATLTVDCRILPGTDPQDFIAEFRNRVHGDYDLEIIAQGPPVVMDHTHPVVGLLSQVLKDADPGCHPVPQMITGFTDARAFDEVGIPCFGFSPVWLPEEIPFASLFHAHDERIPIHGFQWGLATLMEVVRRICVEGEDILPHD